MSYDVRLGVKADGVEEIVTVRRPEYDSPTYNIGDMLRAAMRWDFNQGTWYSLIDVIGNIQMGYHELVFNEKAYKKYNSSNGWGTTDSAKRFLKSLIDSIFNPMDWNDFLKPENLWIIF